MGMEPTLCLLHQWIWGYQQQHGCVWRSSCAEDRPQQLLKKDSCEGGWWGSSVARSDQKCIDILSYILPLLDYRLSVSYPSAYLTYLENLNLNALIKLEHSTANSQWTTLLQCKDRHFWCHIVLALVFFFLPFSTLGFVVLPISFSLLYLNPWTLFFHYISSLVQSGKYFSLFVPFYCVVFPNSHSFHVL